MSDNNAIFRRQPLNYHQLPRAMNYHHNGILQGLRPTPPQFASYQTQPNMEDKVNTRREFWRVPSKENVGKTKFIAPSDSSTLTSARKRNAVGRSSYCFQPKIITSMIRIMQFKKYVQVGVLRQKKRAQSKNKNIIK